MQVPPGELQTPPCSQGGSQTTGGSESESRIKMTRITMRVLRMKIQIIRWHPRAHKEGRKPLGVELSWVYLADDKYKDEQDGRMRVLRMIRVMMGMRGGLNPIESWHQGWKMGWSCAQMIRKGAKSGSWDMIGRWRWSFWWRWQWQWQWQQWWWWRCFAQLIKNVPTMDRRKV